MNFAARRLKILVSVVACNKLGDYSTFYYLISSRLRDTPVVTEEFFFKNWFWIRFVSGEVACLTHPRSPNGSYPCAHQLLREKFKFSKPFSTLNN